jgi:predicted nucleic acid-binding Zn ribbon protein
VSADGENVPRPAHDRGEAPVTPSSTNEGGKAPRTVDGGPNDRVKPRDIGGQSDNIDPQSVEKPVDTGSDTEGDRAAGEPVEPLDLARSVLADARTMAGGRYRRRDRDGARRTRRENLAGRNRGGYSGPGPDPGVDPQRLGDLLGGYVEERGWQRPLAEARVFAEWDRLVGVEVAAHSSPQSLLDGELRVAAESTAWATQLRLLASTVLARLVAELGPDVVRKLVFTGPTAPTWKHGGRSVRGGRGPRDTYG